MVRKIKKATGIYIRRSNWGQVVLHEVFHSRRTRIIGLVENVAGGGRHKSTKTMYICTQNESMNKEMGEMYEQRNAKLGFKIHARV